MKEVHALDEQFFAGVVPAPVAERVEVLGGIRGVVLGGFNEHSAEVHWLLRGEGGGGRGGEGGGESGCGLRRRESGAAKAV